MELVLGGGRYTLPNSPSAVSSPAIYQWIVQQASLTPNPTSAVPTAAYAQGEESIIAPNSMVAIYRRAVPKLGSTGTR